MVPVLENFHYYDLVRKCRKKYKLLSKERRYVDVILSKHLPIFVTLFLFTEATLFA